METKYNTWKTIAILDKVAVFNQLIQWRDYIKFTFTCFAQDGIHQGLIGVLDDGIHYSMISYH